jgi:hypothetical protein
MSEYAIYVDDSGHPDDQPFVVVAGFLSTELGWAEFELEWNQTLALNCLGTVFHMTDFMTVKRKVSDRSQVLNMLVEVIRRHTLACFTGAVDVAAYKRVNDEYALQECLGAPLALAARGVALEMNKWKKQYLKEGDVLRLFAEEGSKHRGDMEEVFKRDRLPPPSSVKKSVPAVQPADMLAWEMFTFLRTHKPLRRVRRLIGDKETFGSMFNENDLRRTCTEMVPPVMLRSQINPGDTISFHTSRKRHRRRTII